MLDVILLPRSIVRCDVLGKWDDVIPEWWEKSITQMALKQFFFISAFRNPLHFTDTQYQIKVTNGCHQL